MYQVVLVMVVVLVAASSSSSSGSGSSSTNRSSSSSSSGSSSGSSRSRSRSRSRRSRRSRSSSSRPLFGVLFMRVPYYIGDPKRDPNLENYPYPKHCSKHQGPYPCLCRRGSLQLAEP